MSEEILLNDTENDTVDVPCEEESFTKESSTKASTENDESLPSEVEEEPANERALSTEEMLKELKALREELLIKRVVLTCLDKFRYIHQTSYRILRSVKIFLLLS